jgi:uncharacterized protein (TIGR02246 family)
MAVPLLGVYAEQNALADTDQDAAAVRAVFEKIVADWNMGNLPAIIDSLAEDAVHMPPGAPALVGKNIITTDTTAFHNAYQDNWQVDIKSIEVSGDLALIRTEDRQVSKAKDGSHTESFTGKGVLVFRRTEEGGWENIIEVWNSNQ